MTEKRSDVFGYEAEIRESRAAIREADQNLSRGYTIYESEVDSTTVGECKANGVTVPCAKPSKQKVSVPVPINADAEQAKIERNTQLLDRAMNRRDALTAQCQGLSRSA